MLIARRHFALGFRQRLAFFARHLGRDGIELAIQNLGHFEQIIAARRRGQGGPAWKRRPRRIGRCCSTSRGRAFYEQPDDFIGVGGVAVFKGVARHPLAVDVVSQMSFVLEASPWEPCAKRRPP